MRVKLIAVTQPVCTDVETPEELIAYCARVSNPANQHNTETTNKLLSYMIKHKHWSPFEMCNVVMEITTTRDISRQILRHRSFAFQEFSQRYAEVQTLNTTREARLQDKDNRQNSIEVDSNYLQDIFAAMQDDVADKAMEMYQAALKAGVAKEQARCLLPEGLTETRMYMNGSVRSWLHYISVRTGADTQKEHREIAEECGRIIAGVFPTL